MAVKSFITLGPGVNLINFFGIISLTLSVSLNYFIKINNIYCIAMKRSSLQNRESKFISKQFYEIVPRMRVRSLSGRSSSEIDKNVMILVFWELNQIFSFVVIFRIFNP